MAAPATVSSFFPHCIQLKSYKGAQGFLAQRILGNRLPLRQKDGQQSSASIILSIAFPTELSYP